MNRFEVRYGLDKKRNLVDQSYVALKKKIIKQDIKPGEYLDEKLLMEEMGVSRTPLRQAILLREIEKDFRTSTRS